MRVQWLVRGRDIWESSHTTEAVTTGEEEEGTQRVQEKERRAMLWVLHGSSAQVQMESFLQIPDNFDRASTAVIKHHDHKGLRERFLSVYSSQVPFSLLREVKAGTQTKQGPGGRS